MSDTSPSDRAALVERIADLIRLEGNPPNAILRLAYLNKARAMEIAARVLDMIEKAERS